MGHPWKINSKIVAAIIEAIKEGNTRATAAELAGIGETTLYEWLAKGRELIEQAGEGVKYAGHEKLLAELAGSLKKAEATATAFHVGNIKRASAESWQASAWWLERRFPKDYGRRQAIEVGGMDGGPIAVEMLGKLSDDNLDRLSDALIGEIERRNPRAFQETLKEFTGEELAVLERVAGRQSAALERAKNGDAGGQGAAA